MDAPLEWRVGDAQAVQTVTGTEVLADVEAGHSYPIDIDHSEMTIDGGSQLAVFATNWVPTVQPMAGVAFVLRCDGTDGQGFRLQVEVADDFVGGDYGYGAEGPDVVIEWSRTGVLDGGA